MTFIETAGSVITDLSDRIGATLTALAQVAGDVVSHLYAVLVKQQVVIGIQYLVTSIWFFLLTAIVYRIIRKVSKSEDIHSVDKYILYAIFIAGGFWAGSKGLEFLNSALPYLINPEYKAILEAVELVKQIKK
ncbi:MAG: hypothetical protein KCHDKBKB_00638 [Elusimicrobia bacterium]|nr:hypothetical protein [Elusimicrobiota bacterium]